MNYTDMNISSTVINLKPFNSDCSINWNIAIKNYCNQWENYFKDYYFYMILIILYTVFGLLQKYYPININKTIYYNNYPIIFHFEVFNSLQNISQLSIFMRIINLFIIGVWLKGGL